MIRSVLVLGALCALPLSAAPKKPKTEKPAQALKRVAKAFGKLKSYEANVEVNGGMAKGHTHLITNSSVSNAYTLLARGKLMKLEGPVSGFRLRGRVDGAARVGEQWKKLLTPKEGRSMTRLCQAPEALLAEALRLKRRAVYADDPGASTGPGEVLSSVSEDGDGTRTGSDRGSSGANDDDALGPQPRHIVIEAQGQIAVKHFERVLSSGCLLTGG